MILIQKDNYLFSYFTIVNNMLLNASQKTYNQTSAINLLIVQSKNEVFR